MIQIHIHIHIHIHISIHVQIHIHISIRIHIQIQIQIHNDTYTFTYTYMYMYMYVYIYICTIFLLVVCTEGLRHMERLRCHGPLRRRVEKFGSNLRFPPFPAVDLGRKVGGYPKSSI